MKDQLTIRIKVGDEYAFELLFRKYHSRLCGFANKFLNDNEESQDVVQEVFTKIWEGRTLLDPEQSLSSYLFRSTQNLCVSRLRRIKIESKYSEIYKLVYLHGDEYSPYDTLLGRELNSDFNAALGKMPPKCRKIFEMSRLDGFKYSEIAKECNLSVKTVETQMMKALKIIRSALRDYLVMILTLYILK